MLHKELSRVKHLAAVKRAIAHYKSVYARGGRPLKEAEAALNREVEKALTPRKNPSVTVFRANGAKRIRVKRNPAASRVSAVLSTRVVDLSYLHAEDKRTPYRHKFAAGVTCQLLSDGSVRLFRPDGKPIWKSFED